MQPRITWFAILALACSTTTCSTSSSSPEPEQPQSQPPAASVSWGAGQDQVGRTTPEEASPEGPSSLVADKDGHVYVLDRVNTRLVRFDGGKPTATIALPDGVYMDVDLEADGGFVLLRQGTSPALVFVDSQGTPRGEVSLVQPGLEQPSMITAIFARTDGVWVEYDDAYMIRVAAPTREALTEFYAVSGRFNGTGTGALRTEIVDNAVVMHLQMLQDTPPTEFARVQFGGPVMVRTLLEANTERVLVSALVDTQKETDPEKPLVLEHVLVTLDGTGKEVNRQQLLVDEGPEEVFRQLRLGQDGAVYQMRSTEQGLEIGRYQP